jgi:hypothetical protein
MKNNHFIDLDESNISKERPTFLTVLCILTFIVSGIWFLSSFFGALTYDQLAQEEALEMAIVSFEETLAKQSGNPLGDKTLSALIEMGQDSLIYHTLINWSTVLSNLLSLTGAYLMFAMKKIGFHVYLVSKIVGLIPLTVISFNLMVGATYITFGIFTIAFLIMYGVNLKHMKSV